jgi:hypothetical protein
MSSTLQWFERLVPPGANVLVWFRFFSEEDDPPLRCTDGLLRLAKWFHRPYHVRLSIRRKCKRTGCRWCRTKRPQHKRECHWVTYASTPEKGVHRRADASFLPQSGWACIPLRGDSSSCWKVAESMLGSPCDVGRAQCRAWCPLWRCLWGPKTGVSCAQLVVVCLAPLFPEWEDWEDPLPHEIWNELRQLDIGADI